MDDLSLAKEYLKQNKIEEAITLLQNIVKFDTCNYDAYFELGKTYLNINKFKDAIINFEKSIKIKDSFWAELLLAKSFRSVGQLVKSTKLFFKIKKSHFDILENIDIYIVENLVLLNKNLYAYKFFKKYSLKNLNLKKNIIIKLLEKSNSLIDNKNLMKQIENDIYEILYSKDIFDKQILEEQVLCLYRNGSLINKDNFYDYILSMKDNKEKLRYYNLILNSLEVYNKNYRLESKPTSLVITLTNVCNIKCIFCNVRKLSSWNLSQEKIKEIIDIMPYVKDIGWLGGEVFLYKDFLKLFDNAVKNGVHQEVVTNGILLDYDIINKFIESNMKLSISITGVNSESYESLHYGSCFKKLIENLEIIKQNLYKRNKNFSYWIYVCVMKENFDKLESIVDFAYEYKFDCIRFQPLTQLNDSFYNQKKVKSYVDKALLKARKYNIKVNNILPINMSEFTQKEVNEESDDNKNNSSKLFCINPWQTLIINYGGFVMFDSSCSPDIYIDNINDKSLLDVWNSQNVQSFRKKIKEKNISNICSKNCINYNVQNRG